MGVHYYRHKDIVFLMLISKLYTNIIKTIIAIQLIVLFAAQLPRRASAYDVYQNRVDQQQGSSPASRRSSFRIQQDDDVSGGGGGVQQKGKNMSLLRLTTGTSRAYTSGCYYIIIIMYFKRPLHEGEYCMS